MVASAREERSVVASPGSVGEERSGFEKDGSSSLEKREDSLASCVRVDVEGSERPFWLVLSSGREEGFSRRASVEEPSGTG